MTIFGELRLKRLKKEFENAHDELLRAYEDESEIKWYDKHSDLYLGKNVVEAIENVWSLRNKAMIIWGAKSLIPFFNVKNVTRNSKYRQLYIKEFGIIF